MKKKKLKTSIKVLLGLLITADLAGLAYYAKSKVTPVKKPEPTPTVETTPDPEKIVVIQEEYEFSDTKLRQLKQEYIDDQKIDNNLKGILVFQSGLVEEPVFQGTDNDYYLYHSWETGEYRSWGSICMEYENDFEHDTNTTIYGHYVYPERSPFDRTIMFTPLALLMDASNYEDNKYLAMACENEIIYYEIIYVYNCHLLEGDYVPEDLYYVTRDFSRKDFDDYVTNIHNNLFYDTEKELSYGDRFITLQTCIEGRKMDREIIICKEIDRKPYPNE